MRTSSTTAARLGLTALVLALVSVPAMLVAQPSIEARSLVRAHSWRGVVYQGRLPASGFGGAAAETLSVVVPHPGRGWIRSRSLDTTSVAVDSLSTIYVGRDRGDAWRLGWIVAGAMVGATSGALLRNSAPANNPGTSVASAALLMGGVGGAAGLITGHMSAVKWTLLWRRE